MLSKNEVSENIEKLIRTGKNMGMTIVEEKPNTRKCQDKENNPGNIINNKRNNTFNLKAFELFVCKWLKTVRLFKSKLHSRESKVKLKTS